MSRRHVILAVAFGVYLLGAGFLGGMLVDQIRFDRERTAMLGRLDQATKQVHARLMELGSWPAAPQEAY